MPEHKQGNFSLIAFALIGIFFASSLHAVQTKTVSGSELGSNTYNLNTGEFASRTQIKPDRVLFNASGTMQTFSTIPDYSGNFSDWQTSYSTNSWSAPQFHSSADPVLSIQAGQIPFNTTSDFTPGDLVMSRIVHGTNALEFFTYNSDSDFVNSPDPVLPFSIGSNAQGRAHALIISSSRLYLFWIGSDSKIHMRTHNGNSLGNEIIFTNTDTNASYGLGGCLVKRSGKEFIALTYVKSTTEIRIAEFEDGAESEDGNLSSAATSTVTVDNISPNQADLTQNPRTGDLYVCWIDGNTGYYLKSNNPAIPAFSGTPVKLTSGNWSASLGMSIQGFMNFETGFALSGTDNTIKNLALKTTDVIIDSFSPGGNSELFAYKADDGKNYAGLLTLSGFINFNFRKRLLDFPKDFSWDKSNKILHLEGPPWPEETTVRAEVDFAEIAKAIAETTNSAGGRSEFSGFQNFIASAGNEISVFFDKDMSLESSYIGNQIKLTDTSNNPKGISFVSSGLREIRFSLDNDLDLNTDYQLYIASDAIDANGSQIYQNNLLSFKTQNFSTGILASEVISISAFSNPARTTVITDGTEINATSTIYLRLKAIDPAFNTVDAATITVLLNSSQIAEVSLTQNSPASENFDGVYSLNAPHGGNNLFEFVSANSAIKTSMRVDFPTLNSFTPSDGADGILINAMPELVFSEDIDPASINDNSLKFTRNGANANKSISLSGDTIVIDPDDSSEGYLFTDTTYKIAAGYGLRDLKGNPFVHSPATFSCSFSTQASQTRPLSISTVKLFSDSGFSDQLADMADFNATDSIYIEMSGTDGSSLTKDYARAQISTGDYVNLLETASSSAIYTGVYSYSGLSDQFELKVQSVKSPAVSASLLITYPELTPVSPASGAINVVLSSALRIQVDEKIQSADINSTNIKLFLNGAEVATSLSYNSTTGIITITPDSLLESEKTYIVSLRNLKDLVGNPQKEPLIYSFTCEDLTPPTIDSFSPGQNEAKVTIDRKIHIVFSENILPASVNNSNILLFCDNALADYSVSVSNNVVTIDPDDSFENFMLTETSYRAEIGQWVTDMAGNGLSNVPATFTLNFSTQPSISPPDEIESLNLYKDALLLESWAGNEEIPASATIYLKVTGTDGATQTKDIATITLDLSWGGTEEILLRETASNSSGIYMGWFETDSVPLFGFPTPLPAISVGTLTFTVDQDSAFSEPLSVVFPAYTLANSTVETLNGIMQADNATQVRIDSPFVTAFNTELLNTGNEQSITFKYGTTDIPGSRSLSADNKNLIFQPSMPLPFSTNITVSGIYGETSLKSKAGNPVFRPFNYSFTTQNPQTQPSSIDQVNLYISNSYSSADAYSSLDDFLNTGRMFIEFRGTDLADNTVDQTTANISTGDSLILNETSASSGIFRGFYDYTNLPDNFEFIVSSAISPTASKTLKLSFPALNQSEPASGSVEISIATPIIISASEKLDTDSLTTNNIKLLKEGNQETPITIAWNNSLEQIELIPDSDLDYASTYFVSISSVKDMVGNQIQTLFYSKFSTQATSVSPTSITSLKAFSDSGYSMQIADESTAAPESQCYIEVQAVDLSPATVDNTKAVMKSDQTGASLQITLVETGPATGVFRGSRPLFSEENATITIFSDTNSSFFTRIKTFGFPKFSNIQPASGSANIFLDARFTITTNKNIDPDYVNKNSIKISDVNGIASYLPVLSKSDEILIYSELEPDSEILLFINDKLQDTDGLSFPATKATFQSLKPDVNALRLYSDAANTIELKNQDQVETNQIIYARIDATDSLFYSNETQPLLWSTETATFSMNLNEQSSGIFTGSFTIPDEADTNLSVYPENKNDLQISLQIMPSFALIDYWPASAAISVAADTWPTWNFTRVVNSSFANQNYFTLTRVNGTQVPGKVTTSASGKQVRFQPDLILKLLTEYEMSVKAGVEDEKGNLLKTGLTTRFVTQPPPPPPEVVQSFNNYETSEYQTSTNAVARDGILYLKLVTDDVSFSTYEIARVRVDSSDGSLDGLELKMIEISPPSGIFTLELPINLPVGTEITIQPQVAPDFAITVTAWNRTRLIGITPASGSADLLLDSPIELIFSQPIAVETVSDGLNILANNFGNINYSQNLSNNNKTLRLLPMIGYATGTTHIISIDSKLKDLNGLFLERNAFTFSTKAETYGEFEMFTGTGDCSNQPVSITQEILPAPVLITASTTNLFAANNEVRQIEITNATWSTKIVLNEKPTQEGTFIGTFTPATGIFADNFNATLLFFDNPSLEFSIATLPYLIQSSIASGDIIIEENPTFVATFSRKMAVFSTNQIFFESSDDTINAVTETGTDSISLSWKPQFPLLPQASWTFNLTELTDYLGQPLEDISIGFSTGGYSGINLYRDSSFGIRIATNQIELPIAFAEIAASSSLKLDGREFDLIARTGSKATSTINLPLVRVGSDSTRFRCSLGLETSKSLPEYKVPMLPGEWLELTSPELTSDKKIYYYRFSSEASPTEIHGIEFYYEKHFQQKLEGVLPLPTLYIQVEAEDLNWFTVDKTRVKITTDSDSKGIEVDLIESGTHSNFFRGAIRIDPDTSNEAAKQLQVHPSQRIFVESTTDPGVTATILYLPENGLRAFAVYPSPVRGNSIFFRFYLNFPGDVAVKIYDSAGHEVDRTICRGREGVNNHQWRLPGHLANGVYFYVAKLADSTAYPKSKRKVRGKFAVLR